MEFYDRFLQHCENLKKEGKSIIVCGDVNTAHKEIDLARPKANEKNFRLLTKWSETGLQSFRITVMSIL